MERHSVESSNLSEVGYDEQTQVLEVMFKNGGIYQYETVSMETYQNLLDAPSVGSFFHYNVKDQYPTNKIA